jgi:hypothetical protein
MTSRQFLNLAMAAERRSFLTRKVIPADSVKSNLLTGEQAARCLLLLLGEKPDTAPALERLIAMRWLDKSTVAHFIPAKSLSNAAAYMLITDYIAYQHQCRLPRAPSTLRVAPLGL